MPGSSAACWSQLKWMTTMHGRARVHPRRPPPAPRALCVTCSPRPPQPGWRAPVPCCPTRLTPDACAPPPPAAGQHPRPAGVAAGGAVGGQRLAAHRRGGPAGAKPGGRRRQQHTAAAAAAPSSNRRGGCVEGACGRGDNGVAGAVVTTGGLEDVRHGRAGPEGGEQGKGCAALRCAASMLHLVPPRAGAPSLMRRCGRSHNSTGRYLSGVCPSCRLAHAAVSLHWYCPHTVPP